MTTNQCDRMRIEKFLRDDSFGPDIELTRHLDVCETCRQRFDAQAAEPSQWLEASRLLQPVEFDLASSTEFSAGSHGSREETRSSSTAAVLASLAPSDHPHRLGRLGTYEISGVVGSGGMGVVLKAVDPTLDRVVAIKVLASHLADKATARRRFAREAKAAAAVLHPNVIPIHGVSSDDPIPWLVMSYVRGGSLQRRLDQNGPLPILEILRIGSQVASGLAAAHDQGLVHRDVKPANILLEEGVERVTLTDFGLARAVDDASVTRDGTIVGTPQYMSPEQARGESVDRQSDLFSLGSVLYALACGRPPFRADSSYGVMRRISDVTPTPIRELNPEIPEWLCLTIEKLMAKDKVDRFDSAGEVSMLLENCLSHLQQPTTVHLPVDLFALQPKESPSNHVFSFPWKRYALGGLLAMLLTTSVLFGLLIWFPVQGPTDASSAKQADSKPTAREGALLEALKFATEDTEYAPGYAEKKFQAIKIGETIESVETKLGIPLNVKPATPYTLWLYAPTEYPEFSDHGAYPSIDRACNVITFDGDGVFRQAHGQLAGNVSQAKENGNVLVTSGQFSLDGTSPGPLGITNEMSKRWKEDKASRDEIRKRFGEPRAKYVTRATKWLVYSRSPSGGDYRKRMVGIDDKGRVCEKKSEFYWD